MKKFIIGSLLGIFASNISFAADTSCEEKAVEKKIFGAAKNSFIKKCLKDTAITACGTQATDKKLAGAAKNSFMKKCEKDAAAVK